MLKDICFILQMSKTCRRFLYWCILFLIFYSTAVCSCIKIYRVSNGFQCWSLNRAISAFSGCKGASCASTCFRPCSGLSAAKTHPQNSNMKAILLSLSVYEDSKHGSSFSLYCWQGAHHSCATLKFSCLCLCYINCVDFTVHRARWDHTNILSHPCLTLPVAVHSATFCIKNDNFTKSIDSQRYKIWV